ncbi:MAG: Crp/Fnr family transcriptional regulator [Terriglobia bacterium]
MSDEISYFPLMPEKTSAKPRLTTLQKAEFIRGLDIFSEASVEELYRLASIAQELDFARGHILFREDDIADAFHILVQGSVELVSEKRNTRAVLGPGEAAGLYSALTREPRWATAQALEDTFTVFIGSEDLYTELSNTPEIVASIFKHFVKKVGMGPKD